MRAIFQLISFLSISFWPHGGRQSLTLQRYHNLILTHGLCVRKGLVFFFLCPRGATFQVVNHLYSPKMFGIYGKHLSSVEKKKRLSQIQGKFFTLIMGVNLWSDNDYKAVCQTFGGLHFLIIQPGFILYVKWITHWMPWNKQYVILSHTYDSQSSSPNMIPLGKGLGSPCGIPSPCDKNV